MGGRGGGSNGGRLGVRPEEALTAAEETAVDFYKEGQDGWGYQAIRYAAQGRLEDYPDIKALRDQGLDDRAQRLQDRYQKLYVDFSSAVEKAPVVPSNVVLTRFSNTFNVPVVGANVTLEKFSSFTKTVTPELVNQFSSTGKVVYKIRGSTRCADISRLGKAFTQEEEVVLRATGRYKVTSVSSETLFGVQQQVVWLKQG